MSNQIKVTLEFTDELLDKILTVMALSSATPQMGGMPMQLMALAGGQPPPTKETKAPIGFGRQDNGEENKEEEQGSKGA